uniref:Zinc finger protein 707-like isoform X2 n=1 Tax=Pogona vitticeps TaxID=103695 RepID=A0ABM5GMA8_9SAUR
MAAPGPGQQVTFEDVVVYFSREEWEQLLAWQWDLYRAVMMENYEALLSLGCLPEKPDIIRRIEQQEEVWVGELWRPRPWSKPEVPWPGDGIRIEDEERGKQIQPGQPRAGRRGPRRKKARPPKRESKRAGPAPVSPALWGKRRTKVHPSEEGGKGAEAA